MCVGWKTKLRIYCWPIKLRKETPTPKEKRKPTKLRKKSLHEIPEISKMETIYIWLESHDPDDYQCDCFEPDLVHYPCVDVTELYGEEKIHV